MHTTFILAGTEMGRSGEHLMKNLITCANVLQKANELPFLYACPPILGSGLRLDDVTERIFCLYTVKHL